MQVEILSQILEALPVPTLALDGRQRVLAANTRFDALAEGRFTGQHFLTVFRNPDLVQAIEDILLDRKKQATIERLVYGSQETIYRIDLSAIRFDDNGAGGNICLVCFEDLAAQIAVDDMRRDFIANVSHELRTPLTAIIGLIETLSGPARDDPQAAAQFLEIMEREAKRMVRLVEDLMSLSRVEEEERRRPDETCDISQIVDQVVKTLTPLGELENVRFDVSLPHHPVEITGDERQLEQVIFNLAENAIKYGGGGKNIRISVSEPQMLAPLGKQGISVTVQDFGEGIPEHHIPRLTERFYRIDTHRSREVGGTGLGLAIVKHIIMRHRGHMRIKSRSGEGTIIVLSLPV